MDTMITFIGMNNDEPVAGENIMHVFSAREQRVLGYIRILAWDYELRFLASGQDIVARQV